MLVVIINQLPNNAPLSLAPGARLLIYATDTFAGLAGEDAGHLLSDILTNKAADKVFTAHGLQKPTGNSKSTHSADFLQLIQIGFVFISIWIELLIFVLQPPFLQSQCVVSLRAFWRGLCRPCDLHLWCPLERKIGAAVIAYIAVGMICRVCATKLTNNSPGFR